MRCVVLVPHPAMPPERCATPAPVPCLTMCIGSTVFRQVGSWVAVMHTDDDADIKNATARTATLSHTSESVVGAGGEHDHRE